MRRGYIRSCRLPTRRRRDTWRFITGLIAITPPLPLTVNEVTADWLSSALQLARPGVVVDSLAVVDVIHGTSTKIRVRVGYSDRADHLDLPELFIIKGGFEAHSAQMKAMYAWEAGFYRDIQPIVRMHSPRCYFAASDPNSYQSVIVMEDLVPRGVDFCSALRPHSFEQVAWRLRSLARLHASTWESANLAPGGQWSWVETRFGPFLTAYAAQQLAPEVWSKFIALPRGAAVSTRFHDLDWMRHALVAMQKRQEDLPYCLIHGDTHLGNLYFEQDGTPGFFDCMASKGPWQVEVSYHIACALDIGNRRRWEGALVGHYLDELKRQGVQPPSFDQSMKDYAYFLAWGYYVFIINDSTFQTESVNTAYSARFSAAMLDHSTKAMF